MKVVTPDVLQNNFLVPRIVLYARYSAEKQHEAWCVALCRLLCFQHSPQQYEEPNPSSFGHLYHAKPDGLQVARQMPYYIYNLLSSRSQGGGSDHGRNKPSLCPQRHHWVVRPNLLFCIMQLLYIQNERSAPRWHARFSLCFQWSRLTHPNHRRARRHRGSVMQSDATQISARVSNEWG